MKRLKRLRRGNAECTDLGCVRFAGAFFVFQKNKKEKEERLMKGTPEGILM